MTDAVTTLKRPSTLTEPRLFLGLCNVFTRIAPNFSILAAVPNNKLGKDQPKQFEPLDGEERAAVTLLKRFVIRSPVLALPRAKGWYRPNTDVCDKQIGCVLLQEQEEGRNRAVGYWSRTLNDK